MPRHIWGYLVGSEIQICCIEQTLASCEGHPHSGRVASYSCSPTHAGGITLPSKELYGHSNSKRVSAFFKYFSSVVSLLNGGSGDEDDQEDVGGGGVGRRAREINDVIDFERQLAGIMVREDNMTGTFVALEKVKGECERIFASSCGMNILAISASNISLSILNNCSQGRRWSSTRA